MEIEYSNVHASINYVKTDVRAHRINSEELAIFSNIDTLFFSSELIKLYLYLDFKLEDNEYIKFMPSKELHDMGVVMSAFLTRNNISNLCFVGCPVGDRQVILYKDTLIGTLKLYADKIVVNGVLPHNIFKDITTEDTLKEISAATAQPLASAQVKDKTLTYMKNSKEELVNICLEKKVKDTDLNEEYTGAELKSLSKIELCELLVAHEI